MKKLFAIAIAASMLSGLYGMSIGLGGAFVISEPVAGADDYSYPAVRGDIMVNALPILGFRFGILNVNIKDDDHGGMTYGFGTLPFVDACIFLPMAMPVNIYIPLGLQLNGNGGMIIDMKGGLGVAMGFGKLSGYLEGGVIGAMVSPEEGDSSTDFKPFYVQGGIRIPVGL